MDESLHSHPQCGIFPKEIASYYFILLRRAWLTEPLIPPLIFRGEWTVPSGLMEELEHHGSPDRGRALPFQEP